MDYQMDHAFSGAGLGQRLPCLWKQWCASSPPKAAGGAKGLFAASACTVSQPW